ncbi:hypothetical protein CgunFtcFv8_022386 [Champsocephalus gunnari]|uniref:MYCBP-associated protein n=1 Tax=Champsocephalus gunnari TaxID=52237 RepID=A0AAN8DYZ0_CHAGU|nr:hypothetical protein CgunFtcFv8_022386 [Champsocephalus gunnari]
MNYGESVSTGLRRLSAAENTKLKPSEELHILGSEQPDICTLKDCELQAMSFQPQDNNKIHIPKPPKGRPKPAHMALVPKTQPAEGASDTAQGPATHPVNQDPDSQPPDCTGSDGFNFDDQEMVLPHSILGTLEDFQSYLEAKGETELVKRIAKSRKYTPSEAPERHGSEAVEDGRGIPSACRNIQSNALQHWQTHMTQRRRQQDLLSDMLDRPVESLLMNQANHYRETQEQREFLNRVMPLIHSGYGYRVGSEFWSLPQRIGDEMSGIAATLTQTEQGRWSPVAHVAQPGSVRRESGIISAETRPASRTWDQSTYLQHQYQELGELLQDMHIKKPEMYGLEVIGSSTPVTSVRVCRGALLEELEDETEHKNMRKEDLNPLAQYDDVWTEALLIPALRFGGQLASWTGNSPINQGQVGISATIIFEALTGERASSHLELHNEGSSAIFYSWHQLPVPCCLANLRSHTMRHHFYFNSSSGVMRPGETQCVEFVFKSEEPGIRTEIWQLNTHPVLLRGASMQVSLRGVALHQDTTADQRLFIQTKLEKIVKEKLCRSIVYDVLRGVRTLERPSSPAELYVTEEQEFLRQNPKLQYLYQPVEDLKRLSQEVQPGSSWDLSVDTLRQVVLSLPKHESAQEQSLARINSLILQLSEPPQLKQQQLTAGTVGQQLWRELLDTMAGEAMWLREVMGLPERDTWIYEKEEPPIPDADMADNKDEKSEKKGGAVAKEERSGVKSRVKEDSKVESKSATTEKSVEDSKKKGKRKEDMVKSSKEKQGKETASLTDTTSQSVSQEFIEDPNVEPEAMGIYKRLLHSKVYALMEDLVDNLCDLTDDLKEGDEHTITT